MNKNEEELEFIAVGADEDNDLNNYMDPNSSDNANSNIGGWIFTQSKVCTREQSRFVSLVKLCLHHM